MMREPCVQATAPEAHSPDRASTSTMNPQPVGATPRTLHRVRSREVREQEVEEDDLRQSPTRRRRCPPVDAGSDAPALATARGRQDPSVVAVELNDVGDVPEELDELEDIGGAPEQPEREEDDRSEEHTSELQSHSF